MQSAQQHAILSVKKRDGSKIEFDSKKIAKAIFSAFSDVFEVSDNIESNSSFKQEALRITKTVIENLEELNSHCLDIEEIQDAIEKELMRVGHHEVAKSYILFRNNRKKSRDLKKALESESNHRILEIKKTLNRACKGINEEFSIREIIEETVSHLYDGATKEETHNALLLTVKSMIEKDPAYNRLSAKLLLNTIYDEVFGSEENIKTLHHTKFIEYIEKGIQYGKLDPNLRSFNLKVIAENIAPERDSFFQYQGIQTLYDRYLLHEEGQRFETPQFFWMRVAMGIALAEKSEKEMWALKFYDILSNFRFVSSTPTLFNAGTNHPQLSSCYISTTKDDLDHIFKVISDNAKLSKWAGGIGNDWTNVRAAGARIKGTNGLTQGIIPFLKVANDTALAVNQGGKRRGSFCAYLEVWHLDIEEFIELRKNTGDDRRRTHDMNIATWISDLFMERVLDNGIWTLFNPSETPELHSLYGEEFKNKYLEYEAKALENKLKQYKKISAVDLWKKMITMLFETGHPWITFKDPSNIRSTQSHAGVIHSSNLCTEILLNTSEEETAVCNLGSINLSNHITNHEIDRDRLKQTISYAMRMLDNVIDINFYPTIEAKNSNHKNRPVGLGAMGFQEALYQLRIPYDSDAAISFADKTQEIISYYAILSSCELAKERGTYATYEGSKWSKGLLPIDTLKILIDSRKHTLDVDTSQSLDWEPVREALKNYGIRNSNTMAIAPTATIAQITGTTQSIEPTFSHLFVKSNLSGEFCCINEYLVNDLKALSLWDSEMIDDLKYFDGSIQEIHRIPEHIKKLYKTSFEIDPYWLIECASRRQKWIDMGQSLNLYISEPSGKKLSEMYIYAWKKGLKTTYYLRSKSATQVEKSTIDINRRGIQPRWMKSTSASSNIEIKRNQACGLSDDGTCESCQ
ncbi:MAG: ribonucleoside-diphosphate reductase subunit alpha [Chlamydiota bacterium]|nr:ribonucleoside-diphosphate reductase subunit alpha [Chlamydiota bacterium]